METEFRGWIQSESTVLSCPAAINTLHTGVISCLLDEGLTFLWGNTSFFSGIHYSMEEYCGLYENLGQYYAGYPEDFQRICQAFSQPEKEEMIQIDMTVRLPMKGGGFFWSRLLGSVMKERVEGCRVVQCEFTNVDALVTEKEELGRLCRQKQQYFNWMIDTYIGNVYISDMDTYELLYLNQNSCETLGRPAGQLLGGKCYEVIQGRNTPCPFCTNDKLKEDEDYDWEFDNPLLQKTFMIKNRMIEWNGHRARIELSHDAQSTEFKLAKKDQEKNAIIQAIPGGFARVDARDMSTVLWYGGGFLDMIGYTKEEFERELHSQCTYVHPDDIERATKIMESSRESGKKTVVEGRIITRDGAVKILTMTYTYVSAEDSWDGIASFYSAGIDITREREEQARQSQALEDAYQAARIANDAKTNFLSSMSHDIRTPMNAIMGMAVIAQANLGNPEKLADCLNKIGSSSRHLLGLINEVLDMSRIESGKIDLSYEVVSLPDLVEEVIGICRPLSIQKCQQLFISADRVRHEKVVTDSGRLQQVLMNLLSNAVKYTPDEGTISLRLRELPSIIPGRGQFEFIVADNGIGMTEDFVRHIFEPFTRAEDSRISKIQGTGLGMTITENIVRMMNGTIEVKSSLGQGSTFILAVSFEVCEDESLCGHELAGLPVLVVDDDQVVCESASELLKDLGMRGDWVLSGGEAVARIADARDRGEDYYFVILDWQMPDMDGLDTVRAIRKKLGIDVPIIIISAYDYSDIEEEFLQAGADAFITKPLFKSRMACAFRKFRRDNTVEQTALMEVRQSALAGKRLLLVEDNELNREIASELLQMQGLLVETAENGRQAVDRFIASEFGEYNGILMDIQMPVMNGYQATETIRALSRQDAKEIPIIALTANAFATDLGKAHSAGMNDHVSKPINMEHLLGVLHKWLA
ncbi:response regulator [Clostridium sp. MCC353]|uniref:PAS domain-containing hybrid sensor histidine kinase/response regulator n=1 Tax=Clostridium sp. MCC353 TaxID=2592646 RepID=UPI001C0167EC|nr:PAS domain-containing hybrid sensor histidine kinase/response regulator [Clostridium sp. MCC353]MBT9776609.1 response regulator [Clostridium sp. MCC353]